MCYKFLSITFALALFTACKKDDTSTPTPTPEGGRKVPIANLYRQR